jgi:aminoglycoside phosphotransferase (APT) family kinase protein
MADGGLRAEFDAVLAAACDRIRITGTDAQLLHLHSNAIFALPSAGLVVRIATNPAAYDRVAASLKVTGWLAGNGFPCTVPAPVDGQPFVIDGKVVSFWHPVRAVPSPRASAKELASVLRDLHSRPLPPDPPAVLTDPLASVAGAVSEGPDGLPRGQREWLSARISQLRVCWAELGFPQPPGLIHGDAHPGNLIRTPEGNLVLGDWDHVAVGPRVWDLAQVFYTSRRFGQPARQDLDGFAVAYGWDPRNWPGLANLVAIRELSGLSPYIRNAATQRFAREELGLRLKTLQANDTDAGWNRPGSPGR